jgi:hypothetical protein
LNEILDKQLIALCKFRVGQKWHLLYRASEHGFTAENFHSKCDKQAKTLTIIKTTNDHIFGGYTEQLWNHSESFNGYKSDENAFIFSLVNKDSNPIKMRIKESKYAIRGTTSYCSIFGSLGGSNDILIASNSNSNYTSYSQLRHSYEFSAYDYDSAEAKCFLAGSFYFQVSEIEVFKQETFA